VSTSSTLPMNRRVTPVLFVLPARTGLEAQPKSGFSQVRWRNTELQTGRMASALPGLPGHPGQAHEGRRVPVVQSQSHHTAQVVHLQQIAGHSCTVPSGMVSRLRHAAWASWIEFRKDLYERIPTRNDLDDSRGQPDQHR
jgi:hypothetical protein